MTNTTNNSTNATTSQFDLDSIVVAFFYELKDALFFPEKTKVMTWGKFKDEFIGKAHRVIESKGDAPGFTTASYKTLEDDGVETKEYHGTPVVRRMANNVKKYYALAIDIDGGMTINEAIERFKHLEYTGYTSHSHLTDYKKNKNKEDTNVLLEKFRLVF
jgi:hypothetical protein